MYNNSEPELKNFSLPKKICCISLTVILSICTFYSIDYFLDNYSNNIDFTFNKYIIYLLHFVTYFILLLLINPTCAKLAANNIRVIKKKLYTNYNSVGNNTKNVTIIINKYGMSIEDKKEFIDIDNALKEKNISIKDFHIKKNQLIDKYILGGPKELQIKRLFAEGIISENEFKKRMDECFHDLFI